jgi:hypothetical protein
MKQRGFAWGHESAQDGAEARDTAIAAVGEATLEWQARALAAIRVVATSQDEFTTDDVWRVLGREPEIEGRAMGAAVLTAARLGLLVRTNYTAKSLRVACHRRDLRVWRSLVFVERAEGAEGA